MEKRKFLYYHLREIDNNKNNIIYNYIINNNINHSENSNGLLLNLSTLDEIHMLKLYDLYNLKGNKINYDLVKFQDSKVTKKKNEKCTYKKYDLNQLEKLILSYS